MAGRQPCALMRRRAMSERWSLAFIHAPVAAPTVFQAVVDAWMQEIDQKLYLQPPGSLENTEQARDPIVRSAFTADSFLSLRDGFGDLVAYQSRMLPGCLGERGREAVRATPCVPLLLIITVRISCLLVLRKLIQAVRQSAYPLSAIADATKSA